MVPRELDGVAGQHGHRHLLRGRAWAGAGLGERVARKHGKR